MNIIFNVSGDCRVCCVFYLSLLVSGINVLFSIDFGDNMFFYNIIEMVIYYFLWLGIFVINIIVFNFVSVNS